MKPKFLLIAVVSLLVSMPAAAAPPGKAILNSPNGVIATATPSYAWSAIPDALWYCLWVNIGNAPKIQTWYSAEQAGCTAGTGLCSIKPATTLVPGSGQWWVQTWNGSGVGPWSDTMNFTYTPNSTKEQAQKLLGFWLFKSTITDDDYRMYSIAEDANKPGEWIAKGEGDYHQPVTGYWSESLKLYAILEYHASSSDYLLTFDFNSSDSVSGCWQMVDKTGKLGTCYKLTGTRFCVPRPESAQSYAEHMRFSMQSSSAGACDTEPDAKLVKVIELLRGQSGK